MNDNKSNYNKKKNILKRVIKRFFTKQDFNLLTKNFFDKKASVYDKEELELYSKESCLEIFNYVKNQNYHSLLDIGCGTGYLINLLSNYKVANYVGLDISKNMIEEAKKKKIKNSKFVEGYADVLPFRKGSFDIVTCSESFHHYPDDSKAIKEAYRVLKNGGYYILADKDVGNYIWYHNFYNKRFKNTGDCNFSNLKRAKKLLKRNDFKLVYSGRYYNNTHYIVVGRK